MPRLVRLPSLTRPPGWTLDPGLTHSPDWTLDPSLVRLQGRLLSVERSQLRVERSVRLIME